MCLLPCCRPHSHVVAGLVDLMDEEIVSEHFTREKGGFERGVRGNGGTGERGGKWGG